MEDKLIPMMSVSIALLLAFRTNRAFERYWYGAQLWTSFASQIRNLSRICWNGIIAPGNEQYQEKLAIMRLLFAAAVATKYSLRHQDALKELEILQLLPPSMASSVKKTGKLKGDLILSYKSSLVEVDSPKKSPVVDDPRFLSKMRADKINSFAELVEPSSGTCTRIPSTRNTARNAPFDIINRVSFYIRRQRTLGNLDPEDVSSVNKAIETTIDCLTKFEQLLSIPVPESYSVHIKLVLSLYFFALPFQLVKPLGSLVMVVTAIVAFALFGADAIASEIEDPFGVDQNDLPIDDFCIQLREDIEYIMEQPGFFYEENLIKKNN